MSHLECDKAGLDLGKLCQAAISLLQGLLCLQELLVTVLEVLLMSEKILVDLGNILFQSRECDEAISRPSHGFNDDSIKASKPYIHLTMPSTEYPFPAVAFSVSREGFRLFTLLLAAPMPALVALLHKMVD